MKNKLKLNKESIRRLSPSEIKEIRGGDTPAGSKAACTNSCFACTIGTVG